MTSPGWAALQIGPLTPAVTVNGQRLQPAGRVAERTDTGMSVTTEFQPVAVSVRQQFTILDSASIQVSSELMNRSGRALTLGAVQLLDTGPDQPGSVRLAREPASVRLYRQGYAWAAVCGLGTVPPRAGDRGEMMAAASLPPSSSDICWLGYDRSSRMALCVGYGTAELSYEGQCNGENADIAATEEEVSRICPCRPGGIAGI
jgi:hypothetical protein